jgi:ABC-type dipeptide/oligopeptide/nickel transport system permease subunit
VIGYAAIAAASALGMIATGWADISTESWAGPSLAHPFGTTRNGQDVLERALHSTQTAFSIGLTVAIASTALGAALGGIAGYASGSLADEAVLWLKGVIDSIPFYLLVAAIAWALKMENAPEWLARYSMHMAMIVTFWTTTGRLVRGEVVRLRELEYVEAARSIGRRGAGILFVHLMPNTMHILLVQATIVFVAAIKAEVILSFLGLGAGQGISWGRMIAESPEEVMRGHFGNFAGASLMMFGLVLAVSLLADALADALDPRQIDARR